MDSTLALAIALLLGGLFVLVLEMFIPSAGILFVIGSGLIIASVVAAFGSSAGAGWIFTGVVLVMAAVLPWALIEAWRRSPLGQKMVLTPPSARPEDDEEEERADGVDASDLSVLRGEIGTALTPMRPAGAAMIAGRRVITVAQGVMIDKGEYVRVVDVQGNRVVVTRVDPSQLSLPSADDMA
jgi:membrane-bound serine protease (ClpP class)